MERSRFSERRSRSCYDRRKKVPLARRYVARWESARRLTTVGWRYRFKRAGQASLMRASKRSRGPACATIIGADEAAQKCDTRRPNDNEVRPHGAIENEVPAALHRTVATPAKRTVRQSQYFLAPRVPSVGASLLTNRSHSSPDEKAQVRGATKSKASY
jgi:hypothetical protein